MVVYGQNLANMLHN